MSVNEKLLEAVELIEDCIAAVEVQEFMLDMKDRFDNDDYDLKNKLFLKKKTLTNVANKINDVLKM